MSHGHETMTLTAQQVTLPEDHPLRKLPVMGCVVGLVGTGICALLGITPIDVDGHGIRPFFFSYLTAFAFFLSIALGGLFFVIIQFVTRAGWSVLIRRLAENIMGTLPIFAILFLPIAIFGLHDLYHWSDPDVVAHDSLLQGKAPYLNVAGFWIRSFLYFTAWILLARWFLNKSVAQDQSGEHSITYLLQKWSPPAIAIFALTQSFASFDWLMSLDAHWYSTMWGVYYFAGSLVAIFSSLAIMGLFLSRPGQVLEGILNEEHFHDLGKLLWGFTIFWAYIAFSQYFLIWYANIPEETIFYEHRMVGSWYSASVLLMIGHFVIPFLFLMSRHIKRNRKTLFIASIWMLLMHILDLYWIIMPNVHHHGMEFGLTDIAAFVGIGGFFLAALAWRMGQSPLVPIGDPRLPESIQFVNQ